MTPNDILMLGIDKTGSKKESITEEPVINQPLAKQTPKVQNKPALVPQAAPSNQQVQIEQQEVVEPAGKYTPEELQDMETLGWAPERYDAAVVEQTILKDMEALGWSRERYDAAANEQQAQKDRANVAEPSKEAPESWAAIDGEMDVGEGTPNMKEEADVPDVVKKAQDVWAKVENIEGQFFKDVKGYLSEEWEIEAVNAKEEILTDVSDILSDFEIESKQINGMLHVKEKGKWHPVDEPGIMNTVVANKSEIIFSTIGTAFAYGRAASVTGNPWAIAGATAVGAAVGAGLIGAPTDTFLNTYSFNNKKYDDDGGGNAAKGAIVNLVKKSTDVASEIDGKVLIDKMWKTGVMDSALTIIGIPATKFTIGTGKKLARAYQVTAHGGFGAPKKANKVMEALGVDRPTAVKVVKVFEDNHGKLTKKKVFWKTERAATEDEKIVGVLGGKMDPKELTEALETVGKKTTPAKTQSLIEQLDDFGSPNDRPNPILKTLATLLINLGVSSVTVPGALQLSKQLLKRLDKDPLGNEIKKTIKKLASGEKASVKEVNEMKKWINFNEGFAKQVSDKNNEAVSDIIKTKTKAVDKAIAEQKAATKSGVGVNEKNKAVIDAIESLKKVEKAAGGKQEFSNLKPINNDRIKKAKTAKELTNEKFLKGMAKGTRRGALVQGGKQLKLNLDDKKSGDTKAAYYINFNQLMSIVSGKVKEDNGRAIPKELKGIKDINSFDDLTPKQLNAALKMLRNGKWGGGTLKGFNNNGKIINRLKNINKV